MIELKPKAFEGFECPVCSSTSSEILHTVFIGTNTIANCNCSSCNRKFFHTYPTGHTLYFPVAFTEEGSVSKYPKKSEVWFALPLIKSILDEGGIEAPISKIINRKSNAVIILNCLDDCYGHVFSKLLNADYYLKKHKDLGLIVIIPKNFLWLIPEGVAEVWIIDTPMKNLKGRIKGFDVFIHNEIQKFDQVYLSVASLHHNFPAIDFKIFLKAEKFNFDNFSITGPQITFLWREDRTWTSNGFDELIYKASVKVRWTRSLLTKYLINKQRRLINKTVNIVKRHFKDTTFFVVGLGVNGRFSNIIEDFRTDNITDEVEKKWIEIYSSSEMVIGVHGSHMLIPTALSAGYLELLPRYKISNYMEDIIPTRHSFYTQYLARIMDIRSKPELIALHIVEMIKGFHQIYYEGFIEHGKHQDMASFYKHSKIIAPE